jgi:hypothetical protein
MILSHLKMEFFERVLRHTISPDPKEYCVRIHKDDRPATIRAGLKTLHPDKEFGEMSIEGGVLDDGWAMSDCMTRTGKSDIIANWIAPDAIQKFSLWTENGEIDLGEEEIVTYSEEQVWRALRTNNPTLMEKSKYRLFSGPRELHGQTENSR